MAIKVQGTTVVDDSRQVQNVREYVQVISANTTAVSSNTYVLTSTLTLTLPTSPTQGDYVKVSNRTGGTTSVIARNSSKIMGLDEDMTIDLANASVTLTYTDATRGWVII